MIYKWHRFLLRETKCSRLVTMIVLFGICENYEL